MLHKSFKDFLNGAINEVNDTQIEGYNSMEDIATWKSNKSSRGCSKN